MNKHNVIGIDLAKTSFQIHKASSSGKVLGRLKITRSKMPSFLGSLPRSTVFMEACPTANYWARKAVAFGHEAKLIAPQYVKPFVKGNKNDATDAEAICEAGSRENMRFVPVKTVAQQDIQSIHRIRERHVHNRTALSNQIRSLLLEYGLCAQQGKAKLRLLLSEIVRGEEKENSDLSEGMRIEFQELQGELLQLDEKIELYDQKIEHLCKSNEDCVRLQKIPGIGPITASAIVAAVGNAQTFENGRQMAAWLGLVPRQHSTGGKVRLLGLSKRGNAHLRTLLIHGGRAVIMNTGKKKDARSLWAEKLKEKVGMNKAAVAMANKNARTIWAILTRKTEYEMNHGRKKVSPPVIQSQSPPLATPTRG